jgi:hypothetical protein
METIERQIIDKQDELIAIYVPNLLKLCHSDYIRTVEIDEEIADLKSQLSEPEKVSGKLNKTAEDLKMEFHHETGDPWLNSQNEPDIDYVAWLENKILNASQFQEQPITSELNDIIKCILVYDKTATDDEKGRYFEVIREDLSKLKLTEQPITDEMIEKESFQVYPDSYNMRTAHKRGAKWALSLKAQKAQPGDEDIEKWIECQFLPTEFDDRYNLSEVAKSFVKDGMRIALKAMREGLIPVSGKDEK